MINTLAFSKSVAGFDGLAVSPFEPPLSEVPPLLEDPPPPPPHAVKITEQLIANKVFLKSLCFSLLKIQIKKPLKIKGF